MGNFVDNMGDRGAEQEEGRHHGAFFGGHDTIVQFLPSRSVGNYYIGEV